MKNTTKALLNPDMVRLPLTSVVATTWSDANLLTCPVCGDLYRAYHSWCDDAGEKSITKQAFGRRLTERGFDSAHVGKSRTRTWIGIGLLTSDPTDGHNPPSHGHRVNGYGRGERI